MVRYAILGSVALVASAASAQGGGWELSEDYNGCDVGREYEGPGSTLLMLTYDGENDRSLVVLSNHGWSVPKGEWIKVRYQFDDNYYEIPSLGVNTSDVTGITTLASDDLIADFAAATSLKVSFAESGALIDSLRLDGSGGAATKFRACRVRVKAKVAEALADKKRLEHIPTDPFAKTD